MLYHYKGKVFLAHSLTLFSNKDKKKSFEEVAFLLKKKITKIKEKTLKNQNAIFVLFWNKEINKYFKAHNN